MAVISTSAECRWQFIVVSAVSSLRQKQMYTFRHSSTQFCIIDVRTDLRVFRTTHRIWKFISRWFCWPNLSCLSILYSTWQLPSAKNTFQKLITWKVFMENPGVEADSMHIHMFIWRTINYYSSAWWFQSVLLILFQSKLKKIQEKYGDQDEEERQLRLELLAVSSSHMFMFALCAIALWTAVFECICVRTN